MHRINKHSHETIFEISNDLYCEDQGTFQNLKILDTAGYRVPRKFQKLGTGFRENFRSSVPLGTGICISRVDYQNLIRYSLVFILKNTDRDPHREIELEKTQMQIIYRADFFRK